MARSSASTLDRRALSFRTGILVSLVHGIIAAPSIDHQGLAPRSSDTASLAVDQAGVLFGRDVSNCTERSLGSQGVRAWEIQDFVFDRFWNADVTPSEFRDEVDFAYNNTVGNSGSHNCHDLGTRSNPRQDGSKLQRCAGGPRDLTHFSLDYDSKTLTLTQTWGCDAADRRHANYFSATEKVVLPLICVAGEGNGTVCTLTGKISVPITNITAALNSDPKDWDEGIQKTS